MEEITKSPRQIRDEIEMAVEAKITDTQKLDAVNRLIGTNGRYIQQFKDFLFWVQRGVVDEDFRCMIHMKDEEIEEIFYDLYEFFSDLQARD